MPVLHVINHTPPDGGRDMRLQRVCPGDAVLFIEDGCYAAHDGAPSPPTAALAEGVRVFVLEADLRARGIAAAAGVATVDYDGFVDLSAQHNPVISWR